MALIFEKKTVALFQSTIREGIKHYYDDLDFKNILDYVQQKSVFSQRLLQICCKTDLYRRSFLPTAISIYNSSLKKPS
ncbi:hypothetical protein AMECASPLE_037104 [Ameca splendens]|uniref:Uncharacterized protein n=1 Tax=Ameca splendens TaxID=208324 RepID=A0ABV0ZSS2_9TELE